MLVITSDVRNEIDHKALDLAVEIIKDGGVVAYATDTCYGFSCDASQKKAVDRLRFLKKMPDTKPISLIFDNIDHAMGWVDLGEAGLQLAAKYWPGDLTIVANKKNQNGNVEFANENIDTIGCRIPSCVFSHKIVENVEGPITTTSANISGMPSPYTGYEIIRQFENEELKPDLLIDSGHIDQNPPSTVIDLSGSEIKILREGSVVLV